MAGFEKPVHIPFLGRFVRDRDRAISFFWLANRENLLCKTPFNLGLCLQQDAQTNQQTIREQGINSDLQLTYCVSSSILYETGNARIRNGEFLLTRDPPGMCYQCYGASYLGALFTGTI